jgi:hypothetical protein
MAAVTKMKTSQCRVNHEMSFQRQACEGAALAAIDFDGAESVAAEPLHGKRQSIRVATQIKLRFKGISMDGLGARCR